MANTIDETKAEIQIGQGWEGIACPIIVKGTTHSYRNIIRKIATSEDVAVEVGKFGIVKIIKKMKAIICHLIDSFLFLLMLVFGAYVLELQS